jgi:hypothetical protein
MPTTTHAAPPPATTTHAPTTSHVATHPVRTTPLPAPTTTAAPSGPVHIVDTFDKSVVDDTTWNVLVNGIGADAVQRNGKLVISVAANSKPGGSYNFVGIQYGTRQCFSGDIDMQVDYRLVTWPAGSGAYVGLQAVFADAMVERFSPPEGGADIYGSMIRPRWTSQPASGTTGSLRLQRVGGVVTTYYLAGGAWQPVDTGPAAGAAHLHIGLSLNPGITPTSGIAVELDNFSATAAGPISGC